MRLVPNEQPPADSSNTLREWLSRLVLNINAGLQQVTNLDPSDSVPNDPKNGMIRYFKEPVLPDITSKGFWGYDDGWTKLH